ncbi:MAG: IPT/TIG domain-containing protein [Candidatus Solibacter sp.]|nr:IPT/TIG domain-containing protein [Candidatus Solibacter sp.]
MRGLSAIRILLLATAAASLGWGQVPTISTLQSSRIDDPPANVTGVTSATASLSNGFRLYINGTFHPGSVLSVRWFNTITSDTELFGAASLQISTTQISVTIPYSHFQTAVLSPQAVTVTVTEAGGSSSATYTVNHPMRLLGPGLPSGTRTLPYDSNLFLVTGGTAPFDFTVSPGTLPPGLTPQPSGTLAGIPTLTGIFFFEPIMTDFWGNTDSSEWTDVIQIIDIPTLTSVAPNSSGTGAGTLTVTVTGTNFVARSVAPDLDGSEVQWRVGIGGATPLSTTFVSPTQLTATVPSALLATAAELNFIVRQAHNSNVNNVTSNALPFSVGLPAISGIVPASVSAGSSAITLTVSGANFVVNADSASRSTVSLNGVALATAFVNSGMLTAAVPAGMMSSPGVYNVQVANPGGTVSNTVLFSVLAPGISSLSTTSLPAGSPAFALTVTGANYLAGSQVSFRSTTLATTFVNSTTLTTTVPFGLITTPGAVNVQVVNPGGALSNIATFTVVAPTLSTILPTSIPAGSAAFTLAVTGTSFVSGAQVWFNGSTLTTTFVSSTALTAAVPGYLVEEAGPVDVKVTNPGGAGTLDLIFNVLRPAITSFSPPSVVAGSATFTLAVGGVNFVPG